MGYIGNDPKKNDAVGTAQIADNAITNAKLADDAIDSADLADASVDLAHMSVNSVDSDQYVDLSIDNAHVATGLDAVKLADGTVTNAELQYINSLSSNAQTQISAKLPLAGGAMTGAITTNSTFDGVDIATRDAILSSTTTTADAALPKAGGAMTGAITTNSTFDGVDIATRDGVLTSTTTTANAALPKAGGTMSSNILFSGSSVIRALKMTTSDGSDNSGIVLAGGGDDADTRGAFVQALGNEKSGAGGRMYIASGNISTGHMHFVTGGSDTLKLDYDGSATFAGDVNVTTEVDMAQSGYYRFAGVNTGMKSSSANTLQLQTSGNNALAIDASQNATFAGTIVKLLEML